MSMLLLSAFACWKIEEEGNDLRPEGFVGPEGLFGGDGLLGGEGLLGGDELYGGDGLLGALIVSFSMLEYTNPLA